MKKTKHSREIYNLSNPVQDSTTVALGTLYCCISLCRMVQLLQCTMHYNVVQCLAEVKAGRMPKNLNFLGIIPAICPAGQLSSYLSSSSTEHSTAVASHPWESFIRYIQAGFAGRCRHTLFCVQYIVFDLICEN